MIYCYLRVSTDMQDVNAQKVGILDFLKAKGMSGDVEWVMDEGVSGAVDWRKRKLGGIIKKACKGDVLVFSEISRIARRLVLVLEVIKECADRGVCIYTVKDRYVLEDTIQSKVLVTVMGLAAEIERDLLRQRTKEGLKIAVSRGKVLGRPKGRKTSQEKRKLHGKDDIIIDMRLRGLSWNAIARRLHIHRNTIARWRQDSEEIKRWILDQGKSATSMNCQQVGEVI